MRLMSDISFLKPTAINCHECTLEKVKHCPAKWCVCVHAHARADQSLFVYSYIAVSEPVKWE